MDGRVRGLIPNDDLLQMVETVETVEPQERGGEPIVGGWLMPIEHSDWARRGHAPLIDAIDQAGHRLGTRS
jgi:hypothetical protein